MDKKLSGRRRGQFSSPNTPHRYPLNTECQYLIEAPELYNIYVNFTQFDLEYDRKCQFDYVQIYDGQTKSSRLIGHYCGSFNPVAVRSSGRFLLVVFVSDNTTVGKGFNATWGFLEPSKFHNGFFHPITFQH